MINSENIALKDKLRHLSHDRLVLLSLMLSEQLRETARGEQKSEPVAVIAAACRLPGNINNLNEFSRLLFDGGMPSAQSGAGRRLLASASHRDARCLEGIETFDAPFFSLTPREAATLDPQQRLLLELAWEALDQGGYSAARGAGDLTGVYLGASANEFQHLLLRQGSPDGFFATGSALSAIAGRLSYQLGLRGPAMVIDTACSSSLVAVHQACSAIRAGECTMALAGGINLMLLPDVSQALEKAGMLSPSGACHTFDERADGYARAEGAGLVLLKPLGQAREDGDDILMVIRGSAVNQNGHGQGLTAPNGVVQELVIRRALEQAGLAPEHIDYVETHGTGTPLGDPVEVHALGRVFTPSRPDAAPLRIGAVKSVVGHCEAAAGIVGLLKLMACFRRRQFPAQLHLRTPSQKIRWDDYALRVSQTAESWPVPDGQPRRAGISSFGFTGTNAHMVVEEPPAPVMSSPGLPAPFYFLPLSAHTPAALAELALRYQRWLRDEGVSPEAVCFSAAAGRFHFPHCRMALYGFSRDELLAGLAVVCPPQAQGETPALNTWLLHQPGVVSPEDARELCQCYPAFRAAWEQCLACVDCGSQPVAAFAVQYALGRLWQRWVGLPETIVCDGAGEFVAAVLAGVLPLAGALNLFLFYHRWWASEGRDEAALAGYRDSAGQLRPAPAQTRLCSSAGEACGKSDTSYWLNLIETRPPETPAGAESPSCLIFTAGVALPGMPENITPAASCLAALAGCYGRNHEINWHNVMPRSQRVTLPDYPYERRTYWPGEISGQAHVFAVERHGETRIVCRTPFSLSDRPWLADHALAGHVVVPGAYYISLLFDAARQLEPFHQTRPEIANLLNVEAFAPLAGETYTFSVEFTAGETPRHFSFSLGVSASSGQTQLVKGDIRPAGAPRNPSVDLRQCRERFSQPHPIDELYRINREWLVCYGPVFQGIKQLAHAPEGAFGFVVTDPARASDWLGGTFHPALLDACFQVAGSQLDYRQPGIHIPVSVSRITLYRDVPARLYCLTGKPRSHQQYALLTFSCYDENGELIAEVEDLCLIKVATGDMHDRLAQPVQPPVAAPPELYRCVWQASSPPASAGGEDAGIWGVFTCGADPDAESLIRGLRDDGQEIWPIDAGDTQMAAWRQADAPRPARLLFVCPAASEDTVDAQAQTLCQALLSLVQGLLRTELAVTLSVWIVMRGDPEEGGASPDSALHEALMAMARVIRREHPSLTCRTLRLSPGTPVTEAITAMRAPGDEPDIFLRGKRRLVPRLAPAQPLNSGKYVFSRSASYLITGGLGDVGLSVAQWMAERGAGALILLSRRDERHADAQKLAALRAVCDNVTLVQADVTNYDQLAACCQAWRQQLPPLRGVVHAAGVLHDALLTRQNAGSMAHAIAPKAAGAWNLWRLMKDDPPDFMLFFSSVSVFMGTPGQVNYAAANGFLDGLADWLCTRGFPAVSINWGAWGQVGAVAERGLEEALSRQGVTLLDQHAVRQGLEQALMCAEPALTVAAIRWEQAGAGFNATQRRLFERLLPSQTDSAPSGAKYAWAQRLAALPEPGRPAELLDLLRQTLAQALRIPASGLSAERGLFEQGLDSLLTLEIQETLQEKLGISLPTTLLFDHPSLLKLRDFLFSSLYPQAATGLAGEEQDIETMSDEQAKQLLIDLLDES